jgi:predicted RNase H-like HicB family nuclease
VSSAFGGIDGPVAARSQGFMNAKVVLEQGEDGYDVAQCPALRSCWSQGRTREEALRNIREAIELYLDPDPARLPQDARHEVVELT